MMDNAQYKYGMPRREPSALQLKKEMETGSVRFLREEGYLVIAPGDVSPLARLLRAALAFEDEGGQLTRPIRHGWGEETTKEADALSEAAFEASKDADVRTWAERKVDDGMGI